MSQHRTVIVHNPHSTRSEHVQSRVLCRLEAAGIPYHTVTTHSPNTLNNIQELMQQLQHGDTILSAAGDGTAMQVANAVLQAKLTDVRVGFLAYGNFNDLSRGTKDPLQLLEGHVIDWHVMSIDINGQPWRYSPGYTTMGVTALLAASFGDPSSRQRQHNTPEQLQLLTSLKQIATGYFHHRQTLLPPFYYSTITPIQDNITDIVAVNNPRVGHIIRATEYGRGTTFGFRTANVSSILRNLPFGLQATLNRAPADELTDITLHFTQPATLPIQTEGECDTLRGVSTLRIYKNPICTLQLLQPKPRP